MQPLKMETSEKGSHVDNGVAIIPDKPIRVDVAACRRLAGLLASRVIPKDEEDSALVDLSRDEVGNFYLLLVAICHQTSPRGRLPLEGTVGGKRKRGWDYLSAKLEAATQVDRSLLDPHRWAGLDAGEFTELFRDAELGERLSQPELRTVLVQDLGQRMLKRRWRWSEDLYRLCEGRVATAKPNLFRLLGQFAAYRDPVRKKSSFLLALMQNSGLWPYADPKKLGPPA